MTHIITRTTRLYAVGLAALGVAAGAVAASAPAADALPTPYRHKPAAVERADAGTITAGAALPSRARPYGRD